MKTTLTETARSFVSPALSSPLPQSLPRILCSLLREWESPDPRGRKGPEFLPISARPPSPTDVLARPAPEHRLPRPQPPKRELPRGALGSTQQFRITEAVPAASPPSLGEEEKGGGERSGGSSVSGTASALRPALFPPLAVPPPGRRAGQELRCDEAHCALSPARMQTLHSPEARLGLGSAVPVPGGWPRWAEAWPTRGAGARGCSGHGKADSSPRAPGCGQGRQAETSLLQPRPHHLSHRPLPLSDAACGLQCAAFFQGSSTLGGWGQMITSK